MKKNSIYIHDTSAVSVLGATWADTWRGLLDGKALKSQAVDAYPEIGVESPVGVIGSLGRNIQTQGLSNGAARTLAIECVSALELENVQNLYIGTAHDESDVLLEMMKSRKLFSDSSYCLALLDGVVSNSLTDELIIPISTVSSACTSGSHALCFAFDDLNAGSLDDVVVIGSDALSLLGILGFYRSGASAKASCRPFQLDRDGTVVSEGAAALSLTTRKTCDEIRIISIGLACDAFHDTKPHPEGIGIELSIRKALQNAQMDASEIDVVLAHGTGTSLNDETEAQIINKVFDDPLVTSIKASIGHTMGACGVFNCLAAHQVCLDGIVPPTTSDRQANILGGIQCVTGQPREISKGAKVLTISAGFGGNVTSTIVGVR